MRPEVQKAAARPVDEALEQARVRAHDLIALRPWRDHPDWRVGRIVDDPNDGAVLSYGLIIFLGLLAASFVYANLAKDLGFALGAAAFLLALASPLVYFRARALLFGTSECFLLTNPARIGGRFEADVRVRLGEHPNAVVIASLYNTARSWRTLPASGRPAQRIPAAEMRIAPDGTRTIPVRIEIPNELRKQELGPTWVLHLKMPLPGPSYSARFVVPIYDFADLPLEEEEAEPAHPALECSCEDGPGDAGDVLARSGYLGRDIAIGVAVGVLSGVAFALTAIDADHFDTSRAGRGARGREFMLPFFTAVFAFAALGKWYDAVVVALLDRQDTEEGREARRRLILLGAIPWAAAVLVFLVAAYVKMVIALFWGVGMLCAVHPTPFGSALRDPLFRAGAALTLCWLILLALR